MNFSISSSKRIFAFIFSAGAFLTGQAYAAGFQLTDFSMTGLGRSYAGAGVVGDDYSAIAFNPAGMALKGSGAQAGAAVIWQHGRVKGSADKTIGASSVTMSGKETVSIPVAVPNLFAQYAVNDSINFGLGVYAPFGLATKYDDDWFGSDFGVDSELEVIDIAPSLSWRINNQWSVGASLIARYGRVKMTNTSFGTGFSDFDIDGWGWYGRFGVMYEASENTRFGLAYQTQSTEKEHTLKGDHTFEGIPAPISSILKNGDHIGGTVTGLPEHWLLSGYHRRGDFGYSASVRYTRWEHFNDFTLTSSSLLGYHTSKYNWENTWTVALGIDWYYNDVWTWRAGVAFDESPVRGAGTRTVRIPDNDRYWLSLGFTYKVNENVKVDVGYAHLYLPTYKARNGYSKTGFGGITYKNVDTKYDVNAEILGIQFQYDF